MSRLTSPLFRTVKYIFEGIIVMAKNRKVIILCCVVLVVVLVGIFALLQKKNTPGYEIVSTNELASGEKTYSIVSSDSLTEKQCKNIYWDIAPEEKVSTLWFFSVADKVTDGSGYDVAMLETLDKGNSFKINLR